MIKKIGISLGIFLLLFSGSWFLDQKQTRTANEVRTIESRDGIMNISNVKMNEGPIFETTSLRFLPREYIRIQPKESNQGGGDL